METIPRVDRWINVCIEKELSPQWHVSVARAFGIGHRNRPAAARLHRFAKQCGQARTLCWYIFYGTPRRFVPTPVRAHLRGAHLWARQPNAKRVSSSAAIDDSRITSPGKSRRGGRKASAYHVSQYFLGVNILDFSLSYPHTHTPKMQYSHIPHFGGVQKRCG